MKALLFILLTFPQLTLLAQKHQAGGGKFILIENTGDIPGAINEINTKKLTEPLLAIAAYYSALGGSNCNQDSFIATCDLTTALGLGNQGSDKQINLIKKWFPNDKAAKQLIAQECYQRPSGASSFSDYQFLYLIQTGNIVTIRYRLMIFSRGDVTFIDTKDKIRIDGNHLSVLKRGIWQEI